MCCDASNGRDDCFKSPTIAYKDLSLLKRIGGGGYGTVDKAKHPVLGYVALKQLREDSIADYDGKRLIKEAHLHLHLNHPNIIRLYAIIFEPGHYGIILEYAPYGHMLQYLFSITSHDDVTQSDVILETEFLEGVKLTERKLELLHDVSIGMTYLHYQEPYPVVHGDLKIENILIGSDRRAKVCDFGMSTWKGFSAEHSRSAVLCGSINNIPPEAWRLPSNTKTLAYDLYGFSILAWHALVLEAPWPMNKTELVIHHVTNGKRPAINKLPKDAPQRCIKVIIKCWADKPENRPNFKNVQRDLRFALNDHRCYQLDLGMKPIEKLKVDERIKGISILNEVLFILCEVSKRIRAFSLSAPFERLEEKEFSFPSMIRPMDMTSSDLFNKLFVSDKCENNTVWVYDVHNLKSTHLKFEASPYRLTATKGADELIVVCERKLNDWEVQIVRPSDFKHMHVIEIPEYVFRPELVIRNTTDGQLQDTFMMFYQTTDLYRAAKFDICEINLEGEVLRAFDILTHNAPHLNITEWWPQYMAMDGRGNLIVCDRFNENLLMVSRNLDNYGLIADSDKGLVCPIRVCLDERLRFIITAHYTQVGGQVAIFSF